MANKPNFCINCGRELVMNDDAPNARKDARRTGQSPAAPVDGIEPIPDWQVGEHRPDRSTRSIGIEAVRLLSAAKPQTRNSYRVRHRQPQSRPAADPCGLERGWTTTR